MVLEADPEYDWQGQLFKKCWECCQGHGPWARWNWHECSLPEHLYRSFRSEATTPIPPATAIALATKYWSNWRAAGYGEAGKPLFSRYSEFKSASRKSWKRRREGGLDTYTQRVRNFNWQRAQEMLQKDFPGEDTTTVAWRQRVKLALGTFAIKVFTTFQRLSPKAQVAVTQGLAEWEGAMAKKAGLATVQITTGYGEVCETLPLEPEVEPAAFVDKLADKFIHPDAAQWNDVIADGVNCYFLCRIIGCGLVCPSIMWIRNGWGWQFRCPACLSKYKPFEQTGGKIPASKIMIFFETPEGGTSTGYGDAPPANVSDGDRLQAVQACMRQLVGKDPRAILVEWPDTSSQNLLNTLAAATVGVINQLRSDVKAQSFEESEKMLMRLQHNMVHPGVMKSYQFPASSKLWIDEYNKGKETRADGQWNYSHLESGYVGFKYPYRPGEAVAGFRQIIQMIALSKFVVAGHIAPKRSTL